MALAVAMILRSTGISEAFNSAWGELRWFFRDVQLRPDGLADGEGCPQVVVVGVV